MKADVKRWLSLTSRPGRILFVGSAGLLVLAVLLTWPVFGETLDNLILSRMGTSEILQFLDASDKQKGLSEDQIAVKYILGEIPENIEPPAKVFLMWQTLTPTEKRNLKVVWFREYYRKISADEVNKHVNIEYLKTRALAEYRESPLYGVALGKPTEDTIAKFVKRLKKPKKIAMSPRPRSKSPGGKKADTASAQIKQPKKEPEPAPLPAPPAPKSKKTEPVPSADKPGGAFKKIPWGGIPINMRNE